MLESKNRWFRTQESLLQLIIISFVLQNGNRYGGCIPKCFFSRDASFVPVYKFRGDTSIACGCLHTATLPTPASPRTMLLIGAVRRRRYPRNGEGDGITGDGDSTWGSGGAGDGMTTKAPSPNICDCCQFFFFLLSLTLLKRRNMNIFGKTILYFLIYFIWWL